MAKKAKKKNEYVNILWFETSLGPQAKAVVEKLCKKLGLCFVDGVRAPHVVTIERGR